jgi:dUTP pyrophosphatase
MSQKIELVKTHANAIIPEFKTDNAVGADLYSVESVTIPVGKVKQVKTGITCAFIPTNLEIQVRSRSGMAFKDNVFVLNSPGTVDPDYRGEIGVILANLGEKDFVVNVGDRIAQLVANDVPLVEYVEVKEIKPTERGDGGFGSTGK